METVKLIATSTRYKEIFINYISFDNNWHFTTLIPTLLYSWSRMISGRTQISCLFKLLWSYQLQWRREWRISIRIHYKTIYFTSTFPSLNCPLTKKAKFSLLLRPMHHGRIYTSTQCTHLEVSIYYIPSIIIRWSEVLWLNTKMDLCLGVVTNENIFFFEYSSTPGKFTVDVAPSDFASIILQKSYIFDYHHSTFYCKFCTFSIWSHLSSSLVFWLLSNDIINTYTMQLCHTVYGHIWFRSEANFIGPQKCRGMSTLKKI